MHTPPLVQSWGWREMGLGYYPRHDPGLLSPAWALCPTSTDHEAPRACPVPSELSGGLTSCRGQWSKNAGFMRHIGHCTGASPSPTLCPM